MRKIHLNLCKNVGTIGSADWVDGRQFSAVCYVEKVLCFCLAALHYLISLHCAARSAFASASASAVSQSAATGAIVWQLFLAVEKVGFI